MKKLRTARLSVTTAIQEALEAIEMMNKVTDVLVEYDNKLREEIRKGRIPDEQPEITLSGHELSAVAGALRDYATLRIANVVDPHPAAKSLKDFPAVDLAKIRSIPDVKKILESRDNWIGHINKRFIGPVDRKVLSGDNIVNLLKHLEMLICTGSITERSSMVRPEGSGRTKQKI